MNTDKIKLHYRYNLFYIISILSIVIIILLTTEWGNIPDLVRYITFGLTLTSLFLSLIVIIYTIFSNFTFSHTITNLQQASKIISESSEKMMDITKGLGDKLETIPSTMQDFGERYEKGQQELLKKLSDRSEPQESIPKETTTVGKDFVKKFLSSVSLFGSLILYLLHVAQSNQISFDYSKALDKLGLSSVDYWNGFMVATASSGLIDYTLKDYIVNMLDIDSNMSKQLRPTCEGKIKRFLKKYPHDEEMKDILDMIDGYFLV